MRVAGAAMRLFVMVLGLAVLGVAGGCGGDSQCERYCRQIREVLIRNFALQAERVDCSDDKWDGDCGNCRILLLEEFEAQAEEGACEAA